MKIEFLYCYGCDRPYGLAAGTGQLASAALPDPFRGTCPHCNTTRIFEKSEITNSAARRDLAALDYQGSRNVIACPTNL